MAGEVVLRLNISKNGPENRDTWDFQNGSQNQEQTLNIYFWIIAFKCFINNRKEANWASISKLLNIYPKGFTKYALRWFSFFIKKKKIYIFLFWYLSEANIKTCLMSKPFFCVKMKQKTSLCKLTWQFNYVVFLAEFHFWEIAKVHIQCLATQTCPLPTDSLNFSQTVLKTNTM